MVNVVDLHDKKEEEFKDRVIHVKRVAKVLKGGRRFSFNALVVVGNEKGTLGLGFGKAGEVANAISKAVERAKKNLFTIPMINNTIPHEVFIKHGAGKVLLKPATRGTGVIAGGPVRAVIEAAGIQDILTKSLGTNNQMNIAKATIKGLQELRDLQTVAKLRGKDPKEIL